ncbi:S24/S26 family peptidase [Natrinema salaciae]|uniref:Signal peptidase, endoplasmic reticulum-type n=1 Tax=Natrinema salaciae TaxID=1186196 RepID=A0A1H9IU50_9EURY|nr:S26 family signal peptidase [Natrinema salaciae]SEQ78123.1 signal peptidase, endoplasmic reticulum-type [Natrinema salaciae]
MDGADGGERDDDRSGARSERSRPQSFPPTEPGNRRPAPGDDQEPTLGARSRSVSGDAVTIEDGVVRWLRETDDWRISVCRDVATSLAIVVVVGLLLFGIAGTWPAFVTVESGSMEPNIATGDFVFVVDDDRFVADAAVAGTGIATLENGRESGHEKFERPGDVIVFQPNGDPTKTPTIHRAHFWVEEDENWIETEADPRYTNGATCNEIVSCPAPQDGFVTKGDANTGYDQLPHSGSKTTVVSPDWVVGKAMVRVPWLGQLRLAVDSVRAVTGLGLAGTLVLTGTIMIALFGAAAGEREP